ncbi:protein-L-isoaspartate O-methyltransferase family protein [Sphingomonas oryzagri]
MSFVNACVLLGRVRPASRKARLIPLTFKWTESGHAQRTVLKAGAAALFTGTLFQAATATSTAQVANAAPPSRYGDGTWLNLSLMQQIVADQHRSFAEKRREMVDSIRRQLNTATPAVDGDRLEAVLSVIGTVPREQFVPRPVRPYAYLLTPLKIGYDQTISDAYIVAIMTVELHLPLNAEVLDVGTGSGYQAAILSPFVRRVSSIEIVKPLADAAAKRLRHLGYRNVDVRAGDGFAGWLEHAPFDAIVVAAGASAVPQPLLDQPNRVAAWSCRSAQPLLKNSCS